jgi:RNA polymerase sigma factor for flagellar operon FliA
MTPESLFLAELPRIERVIAATCRRHRLRPEEAEEFASTVRLKLIDDDYAVLRKFEGRSSLPTFLTVVVERVFLDWRNHLWGKWRPSAEARRLGPAAVRIETLLSREGRSLPEVCQILASAAGEALERSEVERIAERLPRRVRRREEGVDGLERVASPSPGPEREAEAREEGRERQRLLELLGRAVGRLPDPDRLVIRLRIEEGMSIADIARGLGLDAASLYRRIEGIYRVLRRDLEASGVGALEVARALVEPELEVEARNGRARPSPRLEGGAA